MLDIGLGLLAGLEVSMTDLHETPDPKPASQIDTIGWLFLAVAVVITAVAAMTAWQGASTPVANTTLVRAAGPPSWELCCRRLKMPQVCALITIAMQLTCVVDKEILCTDNETLAQFLNVPSCNTFRVDPRSFMDFPRTPAVWRYWPQFAARRRMPDRNPSSLRWESMACRMIALPIWFTIRWRNDPMHDGADLTRRKVFRGRNFPARLLLILDDLIYVITFVNNDLGYSKTGQISRYAQLSTFQLR
jgi:hypothetical protein